MASIEESDTAQVHEVADKGAPVPVDLSVSERRLLSDLFAIVSEHAADSAIDIDRARVQDAFVFACEHHAAQRRKSGRTSSSIRLACADLREHASGHRGVVRRAASRHGRGHLRLDRGGEERFGEEIAAIVDGVTKLTGITFQSAMRRRPTTTAR